MDGQDTLLQLAEIRSKIISYKYIHVVTNDKFSASIVTFILKHFDPPEHCFLFCGGRSADEFPIPEGDNIFSCSNPAVLAVSDAVSKIIFHGLYDGGVVKYLSEHPEIMAKSYWASWGGDLYDVPSTPTNDYVHKNFQGVAVDAHGKMAYRQKYGEAKAFFPFNICFESIEYERIVATPVPQKKYVQIQVNNSAHPSTLEVFQALEKFRDENIRVTTVLSYGRTTWNHKILSEGHRIFGDKFCPVLNYIPKETYIKLLARNDIYILNQERPQGVTTSFTSMVLGCKVFMRGGTSWHLHDEGYTVYDTQSIPGLSFEEFCANPAKEENQRLAPMWFDPAAHKQCWKNIFDYEPPKPGGV